MNLKKFFIVTIVLALIVKGFFFVQEHFFAPQAEPTEVTETIDDIVKTGTIDDIVENEDVNKPDASEETSAWCTELDLLAETPFTGELFDHNCAVTNTGETWKDSFWVHKNEENVVSYYLRPLSDKEYTEFECDVAVERIDENYGWGSFKVFAVNESKQEQEIYSSEEFTADTLPVRGIKAQIPSGTVCIKIKGETSSHFAFAVDKWVIR